MNTQTGDLRLLLRLLEGTLPAAEGLQVRERLASDRELRQRWQLLNSAGEHDDTAETVHDSQAADDVAAFLDGSMTPERELEFEAHCWRSPDSLAELRAMVSAAAETPEVSAGLTQRLMGLMPAPETHDSVAPQVAVSPEPMVTPADDRAWMPSPRSPGPAAMTWVVGTVLCLLLGVIVWFAIQDDEEPRFAVGPDSPEVKAPDGKPPEGPGDNVVPDRPPVPDPGVPDQPMVVDVPEPDSDPGAPPEPDRPPLDPAVPRIQWAEVNGIVAARASVRDRWRGVDAIDQPQDGQFATMPLSRAIASGPRDMELVIDSDSHVDAIHWGSIPEVRVLRGRVAFRNLAEGTKARFVLRNDVWEVTSRADGSTVAININAVRPVLSVHAGAVDVGRRRLKRFQYLVGDIDSDAERVENSDRLVFDGWLNTWQASIPVSAEVREALRQSDNLQADLQRLSGSGAIPQRIGDRLTFSIAPEQPIARMLLSRRREDRDAAVVWLIHNPIGNSDRGSAAWATIGRRVNNEAIPRMMNEWLTLARRGQSARSSYPEMVRCLRHQHPLVRHVAVFCLRHFTQRNFGYDPIRPNANQGAAIRTWQRAIRALP